jgi:hypothetical protein
MEVPEAKRLRALEDQNVESREPLAEQILNVADFRRLL